MQLIWLIPTLAMGVFYGVTTGMWQLAVMSGASALIMVLVKLRREREFTMRITAKAVVVNGRRVWRPFRFWPERWRSEYQMQLKALLAAIPRQLVQTRHETLSFVCGYDLELNLERDGPHLFLVGPTGSGKSRWLNMFLNTLTGKFELKLADFKGGATLAEFGECISDLSEDSIREAFWRSLEELLSKREHYLQLHQVSEARLTSLAPVVVVVDELAAAIQQDRAAMPALSAIAARGRSLGVHLVCANQSVSGVPRELLVNLNLRIILAGIDEVDAMQLGAKSRPQKIQGVGSGLVIGREEFCFPFRKEPIRAT